MNTARPRRRHIVSDAVDLDFDYFADTTGLAADGALAGDFDSFADLLDLYAEMGEIDSALAELDAPIATVVSLPGAAQYDELGEVA